MIVNNYIFTHLQFKRTDVFMYLQSFDQEYNKDELILVQICEAAALQI